MRPTRPMMWMAMAQEAAKRATCMRLNVGAVIVSGRHLMSMGYNGFPQGEPHCTGNICSGRNPGGCPTIHAEVNALEHLPDEFNGTFDIYCTDSPCQKCAEMLAARNCKRVFFAYPYRITDSLDWLLRHQKIPSYRVLPAGYVMDWTTKELVDVEI